MKQCHKIEDNLENDVNGDKGLLSWKLHYVRRNGRASESDCFKKFMVKTMRSKI